MGSGACKYVRDVSSVNETLDFLENEITSLERNVKEVEDFVKKMRILSFVFWVIYLIVVFIYSSSPSVFWLLILFAISIHSVLYFRFFLIYRFNALRHQVSIDQKVNFLLSLGVSLQSVKNYISTVKDYATGAGSSEGIAIRKKEIVDGFD